MNKLALALALAGCHGASATPSDAPAPLDLASPSSCSGGNDVLVGSADLTAATLSGANPPGVATAFHFTAAADGTACRLHVYLVGNAAYRVHVGLYDGAALPGALVTAGDLNVGASTAGYWVTGVVAPAAIKKGADYWLAVTSTEGGAAGYAHGSGAPSTQIDATDLPAAWPQGAQRQAADAPLLAYASP